MKSPVCENFAEELATEKITGQLYKMGVPYGSLNGSLLPSCNGYRTYRDTACWLLTRTTW